MLRRSAHAAESSARLRTMSAPELSDALERADIEAKCRRWSKRHGMSSSVLRIKLQESEAKAVFLGRKAAKHRAISLDERASPQTRALSGRKHEDYQRKYDRALRVCTQPARPIMSHCRSHAYFDGLVWCASRRCTTRGQVPTVAQTRTVALHV